MVRHMLLLKNYPLLGYEFHIISCSIFMLNINSSILSFKFPFFFPNINCLFSFADLSRGVGSTSIRELGFIRSC